MFKTVDQKILKELTVKRHVSTVRLGHRSGSFAVHSAIARLRKAGWNIECEMTGNGKRKAWYHLVSKRRKVNRKS